MDIGILVLKRINAATARWYFRCRLIKMPDRIWERPPYGGLSLFALINQRVIFGCWSLLAQSGHSLEILKCSLLPRQDIPFLLFSVSNFAFFYLAAGQPPR
jgi:hypothetical protein